MARPLRIHFPGAIYHVCSRMLGSWKSERNQLFRDDKDRERFLGGLQRSVQDFEVRLYLFCLMSNHFHLLVETPRGNLSKFMQSLNTGYTVYYNRRHRRHGHLLDGRYKSELVAGDEYLLKLSRYIHLNPVSTSSWKNGAIEDKVQYLRSYCWSSYPMYIGKRKAVDYLDRSPLYNLIKVFGKGGPRGFREYVEFGLVNDDVELREVLDQSSKGIGDLDFRIMIEGLKNRAKRNHGKIEDVAFRRQSQTLPQEKVISVILEYYELEMDQLKRQKRGTPYRPVAAKMLFRYCGMTQREIADFLVLKTGAAVSAQISKANEMERTSRKIKKDMKELQNRFINLKHNRESTES